MKEKKIDLGCSTEFTTNDNSNSNYFVIGTFGAEGTGKTKFPITGPEVIGFIPLERKSYPTIDAASKELDKVVWRPKDPEKLITNPRKANMLAAPKDNTEKSKDEANDKLRAYYRDILNRINDSIYAMLEHDDIRTVVIDTFTQYISIVDSALYGFQDKFIKVQGQLYKDRREFNQEIIDLLNSFHTYNKNVILINRQKDEYNDKGPTGRKVWEGFKFLGNYCNMILHHESNPKWNPNINNDPNRSWHFALSVRTCQQACHLEGPEGYRFLKDDEITIPMLLTTVNPEIDPDAIS
jgi:hypothetical protein